MKWREEKGQHHDANNVLQNITQKTKRSRNMNPTTNRAVNSGDPILLAVPAPQITPVKIFKYHISYNKPWLKI